MHVQLKIERKLNGSACVTTCSIVVQCVFNLVMSRLLLPHSSLDAFGKSHTGKCCLRLGLGLAAQDWNALSYTYVRLW